MKYLIAFGGLLVFVCLFVFKQLLRTTEWLGLEVTLKSTQLPTLCRGRDAIH